MLLFEKLAFNIWSCLYLRLFSLELLYLYILSCEQDIHLDYYHHLKLTVQREAYHIHLWGRPWDRIAKLGHLFCLFIDNLVSLMKRIVCCLGILGPVSKLYGFHPSKMKWPFHNQQDLPLDYVNLFLKSWYFIFSNH